MTRRTYRALPALAMVMLIVLGALPAYAQDDALVTHYTAEQGSAQITSLDPQTAYDSVSIDYLENLFLGLTDINPFTTEIEPEMATSWAWNPDTFTWTFTLRDDVPWVRYDPTSKEFEELRMVTAQDFVTGIHRACDPNNPSLYAEVIGANITGCAEVYAMSPGKVALEDFDLIGVNAPDDTTLEITLVGPVGYFFSMTPMWTLRAVPGEIIESFGEPVGGQTWTQPGNIVTNGPFVIDEWERGVRRVLIANPLLPADLRGPGNVDRVVDTVVTAGGTTYALYQDDKLDWAGVPSAELQNVLADPELSQEVTQTINLSVSYFNFAHDKAPFDNVHARRAFSAAVNRDLFVSEILQQRGVPMMHFVPPGMFGSVPVNEVGIDGEGTGFDPEYARQQMAEAGYPDCEGFPEVTIATGAPVFAEFLVSEVQNTLGCDPSLFTIEQQPWTVLLQSTRADTPTEERPNMWSMGWNPDYRDAHNWYFDAGLHCESSNDLLRPCGEVDEKILQAQMETDPEVRASLYREISEDFFDYDGDYPVMPLYMSAGFVQIKPWLERAVETDGLFGGVHYDWVTIDQGMQGAARGEK